MVENNKKKPSFFHHDNVQVIIFNLYILIKTEYKGSWLTYLFQSNIFYHILSVI